MFQWTYCACRHCNHLHCCSKTESEKSIFNEFIYLKQSFKLSKKKKSNEHVIIFDRRHLVSVGMWWNKSESFLRDFIFILSIFIMSMICYWDKHATISWKIFFLFLGNASLISEALRHYQRLERQNDGETSTKKLDKHNRRHHVKDSIEQAVTHKIKVSINQQHWLGPLSMKSYRMILIKKIWSLFT